MLGSLIAIPHDLLLLRGSKVITGSTIYLFPNAHAMVAARTLHSWMMCHPALVQWVLGGLLRGDLGVTA